MNKKNKGKRASATIIRPAHKRLKALSKQTGFKMEALIDSAVWNLLKNPPIYVENLADE